MQKLSDEKPVLYHYTTAAGLLGIIGEQKIHATSIRYLNDAAEQVGYVDGRLPHLLKKWAREVGESIDPAMATSDMLTLPKIVVAADEVAGRLHGAIRELAHEFDDPYVASFSALPAHDPDDGLLSQWRAYGPDGGYVIAFETAGLERLLEAEHAAFHHLTLMIGDVEYYNNATHIGSRLPETDEDEETIRVAMRNFMLTGVQGALEPMYAPLMSLSVRSKHHGFREESEVRIVAMRSVPKVRAAEEAAGERRPQRELKFKLRDGLLVPYIELFGADLAAPPGSSAGLPIKRIIVGPHPDKHKRRASVQKLLDQCGINADVTVSAIPYLPS